MACGRSCLLQSHYPLHVAVHGEGPRSCPLTATLLGQSYYNSEFKFNFVCCVELKVMAGVSLVFGVRASCKHTVVALEKMSNRQAFTAVVADDVV